jgi:heptosyltransferase-2
MIPPYLSHMMIADPAGPLQDRVYPTARPAMRGPYLIRNPSAAAIMTMLDAALGNIPRRQPSPPPEPRRILLCNWAHLGDVLLTLPAVGWLRERFPDAELGFLAGSWSAPILHDARDEIARVHTIDHHRLARSGDRKVRMRQHVETARTAIREIRAVGYDVAIDFHPFFPNAGFTLWRAGVPVRIGWTSGGLGAFFTHGVRRIDADRHVIDYHQDLLAIVAPETQPTPGCLRPVYFRTGPASPLPAPLSDGRPYVVLHTGTGAKAKEWQDAKWISVAQSLAAAGKRILVVGAGAREGHRNRMIAAAVPGVIDLTNTLDWPHLVSVVEHCEALVCLESVAGHIAASFGRPVVSIMPGMNNRNQWGPLTPQAALVTHPTPCAPCHRAGCKYMYCVAGVMASDVTAAVMELRV